MAKLLSNVEIELRDFSEYQGDEGAGIYHIDEILDLLNKAKVFGVTTVCFGFDGIIQEHVKGTIYTPEKNFRLSLKIGNE